MPTTGGALAFEGYVPPYEATLTTNLRDAGAIILAKTVMTELANFMANGMPGNYSAVGGYGLNPYDPRRDPREGRFDGRPVMGVGGSSSGSALRPTSGRVMWARRRRAPSCRPRTRTCWQPSSRPWDA